MPRPASKRASTRRSVSRWLSALSLRHAQALLQAAQFEVAARDLADDRDLQRGQVGRTGRGLGALRFDAAADAAEQVQFPAERRSPALVALAVAVRARHAGRLVGAGAGVAGVGLRGDGRQLVEPCAAQQCIRAVVARQCDAQVVVGDQRSSTSRVSSGSPKLRQNSASASGDGDLPSRCVGAARTAPASAYVGRT